MCLSACDNDICEDMHGVGGDWMVMATCMFIPLPYQIDFFWLTQKEYIMYIRYLLLLLLFLKPEWALSQ